MSEKARDRLSATARAHRVERLVAWRMGRLDDELRAAAILDAADVVELNRVLAALEEHGVAPLVLKGASLAHTHYEQSWLRPRVDADVMIASSHRSLVIDVLRGLGYAQPPFISGDLVMYQMPFARLRTTGETHLDVHWRIANSQILADLPGYEELATRASTVLVRGQLMRTPCPVDALLLACVHRAAHHALSDALLWLYDIHLLAQRFSATEWGDFVALTVKHRVRALCCNGLLAAHDCFHTAIPADVVSRLSHEDQVEPSTVYLRKDLSPLARLIADLRVLAPPARVRLFAEHLIPPVAYIRQKYDVRPGSLLPLFYVRRLAEGLPRFVRRV